ncbi:MAG: archease [Nitrospirota bacterium]|nr:MAG: archease [Nitrospirota bacterium]
MKEFEVIDISGDVGLRIYGNTLEKLFENASTGLYTLITGVSKIESRTSIKVKADGDNMESLLIAFLNELIFHFDTNGFIGNKADIHKLTDNNVEATIYGEEFDPERHEGELLIKAATYHKARLERTREHWQAKIIFDI